MRDRTAQHDHIEGAVWHGITGTITLAHFGVLDASVAQVFTGHAGQRGVDFEGHHALGPVGQQGRHVARACANFQHTVGGLNAQVLQDAGFHAGLQHAVTLAHGLFRVVAQQGHFDVSECQAAVSGWHKVFAAHDGQQLQHVGIQHVPGPDLLLDHVVAGLGDGVADVGGRVQWQIHRRSPVGVRVRTNPEF